MKTLMLKLEPVIWGLFGAGMMVGVLLFPAWLLVALGYYPRVIPDPEAACGVLADEIRAGCLRHR